MTPEVSASLAGDGRATLTIDGKEEELFGRDVEEARVYLIRAVAELAEEHGYPVIVEVTEAGAAPTRLEIDASKGVRAVAPPEPAPAAQTVVAPPVAQAEPERLAESPAATAKAEAAADDAQPTSRRELRRPTAADFAMSQPEAATAPAQEGWRGVINQVSGGAFKLAPTDDELQRRKWRASIQRGVTGHKTAAVVQLKGGASKTTVAWMVGATLGRVRGGNILVGDNNENKGTLGARSLMASHENSAIDLLENVDRFNTPSNAQELVNYVHPQGNNKFHVLASQNKASNKPVIDGEGFTQLHQVLRQFYHMMIVDTGNASTASTWQAAVDLADELVIVTMNKEDAVQVATATADVLAEGGYTEKLARGVFIITETPLPKEASAERKRKDADRLRRAIEHFTPLVREIVVIPYDPALDDGAAFDYDILLKPTKEAYLKATAAIMEGF